MMIAHPVALGQVLFGRRQVEGGARRQGPQRGSRRVDEWTSGRVARLTACVLERVSRRVAGVVSS